MHRCSISASTQLNLTVGAFGAAELQSCRAAERERLSFGDIVGRVLEVSWHQGSRKNRRRERKARVNKERRAEVVPVLFVWFLQRPVCERAVKERGGPSSSQILCSFVFFDVVSTQRWFFLTAARHVAKLQSRSG